MIYLKGKAFSHVLLFRQFHPHISKAHNMYQVKDGDYAQAIADLNESSLKRFRQECEASLKDHLSHSVAVPASYTVLTAHGSRRADDAQSLKAVQEDEKRFDDLRQRELNHDPQVESSAYVNKKALKNKLSPVIVVIGVFLMFALIGLQPLLRTGLFDPMFLCFIFVAALIIFGGLSGKKHRGKGRK